MIKEARKLAGLLANISAIFITITLLIDLTVGARYAVDITYSMSNLTETPKINFIPMYIFTQAIYIPLPVKITLTQLATIFIIIYAALLALAMFTTRPLTNIKEAITGFTGNDAIETMKIMSVTLITIIIVEGIQEWGGIPTGQLQSPNEYIRYISALVAPLIEEIGFRLSIIGVIATVLYLATTRKKVNIRSILTIIWRPYHGHDQPGENRFILSLYLAMVITAVIFGVSHVISGGGWEIGKVTTATIAGIALGYLYIRHGFHSAVLGHAFFNVYLLSMYYLEQVGGIVSILVEATYIAVLILSALYTFYIILGASKYLSIKKFDSS